MDMDPSTEDSEEGQEEQERMRGVYEQLEEGLEDEDMEQWRRRRKEDEKKKEQDWEVKWMKEKEDERERKGYEEWKRKREENDGPRRRREEEEKQKKEVIEPAYEKLQAEVKKYDDGMVAGWKEDIDTLLAGLFSAVVTAFLIESYQWLSEDTIVVLLTQISQQLNGTQTQPTPFTPEASSIRINCFWFLSLIFSLTSALFGLLCKQWLREHQRDVPTRTAAENLALRQLRRDSFEKWGVASFLSALPILLEIALVFFFVGVLDLLWTLHPIVFGICLAAISLSIGLYFLTTILPTITIPRDQTRFIDTVTESEFGRNHHHDFGQLAYQFICPYKSPQAWAVYKLITTLPKPLLRFPFINNFTKTHLRPLWDHIQAQTPSWSTFDLRVVRQFDQQVIIPLDFFQLPVYELQALQWAVTMFRDSPSMIPHLENVLKTLPRSMAISAVLDRWDIAMWEGQEVDVGVYLRRPTISPMPKPITGDPPLHSREGIELLFWHQIWGVFVERGDVGFLSESLEDFTQKLPKSSRNLQFFIPLPFATALWSRKEFWVRQGSILLLRHFEDSWKPSSGYDEERHNKERVAFANGLAVHICYSDPPSVLLTSKRGQEFIRFIHHEIIIRRLYSRDNLGYYWEDAIQKVREVGKLPNDYFAPLPRWGEDPPPSSQLPQLEPIRYSQDTIRPQSNNPQNKDGERPPTPAGNVENLEIQVHGSQDNITGELPDLADGTLVPGSANPGSSGSQALKENDVLPMENDELRTPRRMLVEGTTVTASDSVAEGSSVPSLARDDEFAVPREVVLPFVAKPGRFTQVTDSEDSAQASSSPFEVQGKGAGYELGLAAVDKSSAMHSENDAEASERTVAVGTNHDRPRDSAMGVTEGSPAPLAAGGDKLGVSREVVPADTSPNRPMQADEDPTQPSKLEGQGERARDDHEEQATAGAQDTADPSSSRDRGEYRGQRRDGGRGWNVVNDPYHLRMHWFRS
ncbi:hypothetical protein VNI00_017987 [Paramarasmius palmivorus]|uniref:DUF6535 domain-containing protein n=1 Tax=Paramarasmius palmivorus TaxID=297713 RepID=A0AAW0B2B0_9AGAR